jgi:hypothetical protein
VVLDGLDDDALHPDAADWQALCHRWPAGLQVLSSSRRPLALPEVWRLPVTELSDAAAVQLLEQGLRRLPGPPEAQALPDGGAALLRHTGGWPWAVDVAVRLVCLLGPQALLRELHRHAQRQVHGAAGLHWLDEAGALLNLGQPFGLALQVHAAWQALPLGGQVAVQALVPLGPRFALREALAQGATLADLCLLREHGWLQASPGDRLAWGTWCRDAVAGCAAVVPIAAATPGRTEVLDERPAPGRGDWPADPPATRGVPERPSATVRHWLHGGARPH